MRRIIGLAGGVGSGKDTAASAILQSVAAKAASTSGVLPFAQEFRHRALVALGFVPYEEAYHDALRLLKGRDSKDAPQEVFNGRTPRFVMETFSDWVKGVNPNVWVDHVRGELANVTQSSLDYVIVVPDVRFVEEARMLRELGAEIWGIVRPENPYPQSDHISNRPLTPDILDGIIYNVHDTEAGFKREVRRALKLE